MDHVVVLPENPLVTHVTCTLSTLTVAVSDAGAGESWLPDHTLLASAVEPWLCPDATGEARPFLRKITAVRQVHVAPRVPGAPSYRFEADADSEEGYAYSLAFAGRSAVFTFETVPVEAHHAFKHLDTSFVRTPPRALSLLADIHAENATLASEVRVAVHEMLRDPVAFSANGTLPLEVALARRLSLSDEHARRLGFWSSVASVASSVCSSCVSAVRTAATVVTTVARAVVNDGRWELDGSKRYDLLNWAENTEYINSGGARVWCDNCRAYLGGGFIAVARFKWAELLSAEVSAYGSATFAFGIRGSYNSQSCVTASRQYPSNYRQVASFTVPIFGIPVQFTISGRVVAQVAFRGTGTATFQTPSIALSASVKMGVEYVSGWRTIQQFSTSRSQQAASYRVSGAVQATITPHIDIQLSIWNSWNHVLRLSPSLTFRAMNTVPSSCVTTFASDRSNVARCPNQVWTDISYAADMAFTIGGLSISVPVFGTTYRVAMPGLPRTFPITLVQPTLLTGMCLRIPTSGRLLQAAASCASVGCAYTTTAWSACSVTCGTGQQTRVVACAAADGTALDAAQCAATPGLAAPAATQVCERACVAAGYTFGSSGTGFSSPVNVMRLNFTGAVIGQRLAFGSTYDLRVLPPPYFDGASTGLYVGVIPLPASNGDADIELATPARAHSSIRWGPTIDAVTATSEWALGASTVCSISISVYDPASSLAELAFFPPPTTSSDHVVKIIPFHDVTAADQLADFPMSGTPAAPDVRYFRFYPDVVAEGVFFAVKALVGAAAAVDVYAARLNDGDGQDWPLWGEMPFSSLRTPPRRSIAAATAYRSVLITDADYRHGYYAVAIVATGAVTVRLTTTDLQPIMAGVVQRHRLMGNAMRMFRYVGRATDSVFYAQLTAIAGDPDLFATRRPWSRPPFYGTTDSDAQWKSANEGSDSLAVWDTHPAFGDTWYIAVTSYLTASDWRIAVQSYEMLDQGVPVTRLQQPSTYSYFLGSFLPPSAEQLAGPQQVPGSNVSQFDSGLSFFARIRGTPDSITSLDLLAGGQTRFWPAVFNGREGMAVRGLSASSPPAELSRGYLDGSDIARPLIMSVLTGYSGAAAAGRRAQGDETSAPSSKTVTLQRDDGLLVQLPDLTSEEPGEALVPSPPAASEQSSVADGGRSLQASTAVPLLDSAVTRLLDAQLLDEVVRPGPIVLIQSPASGVWATLSNCSLSSSTVTTRCVQVTRPGADTVLLRVRVPARTSVTVTIAPTLSRTDGVVDAPYTFTASSDDVPNVDGDGPLAVAAAAVGDNDVSANAPIVASMFTLPLDNCRFVSREVFMAIAGNNNPPAGRPIAFDIALSGESADGAACPTTQWLADDWSGCSAVCGAGQRTRTVTCTLQGGIAIDDENCNAAVRPAAAEACDAGACTWAPLEWSDCTRSCGGGTQLRLLECRNGGGTGVAVLDRNCATVAAPVTSQPCGTAACPALWWEVSAWSACSAKCGGGYQTRTATCRNAAGSLDTWKCEVVAAMSGPMPATERECGTVACAPSGFQVVYFDARALESGRTRRDVVAPLSRAFYSFSPSVGTRGMCLRVDTALPSSPICGNGVNAMARQCSIELAACVTGAARNATAAGTVAGDVYEPFEQWGTVQQDVPPAACTCFTAAQQCVAQLPSCMSSLASTISSLSTLARGCAVASPVASTAAATSLRPVRIFGSRYNSARDTAGAATPYSFLPPTEATASTTLWPSYRTPTTGTQWVVDWDPEAYTSSRDPVMVGIVSGDSAAVLNVTATALTALPVTSSGTAFASTVSAAAVRQGGLTMTFTLSCDRFATPATVTAGLPTVSLATPDIAALGNRLTANFVAAGFMARRSVAGGWNRVVRSALLAPAAASFAAISPDGTTLSVTLPAMAAYSPSVDEEVTVTLPFAVLASGRSLPLTTVMRIVTDRPECVVSEWGSWSPCSATCARGTQTRTRTIRSQAAAGAAGCPELAQVRSCDTCNPCEGVSCANGAICTAGACVCPPGFAGRLCESPAAPAVIAFWTVSDWSNCSAACGTTGTQTRTSICNIREGLITRATTDSAECITLGAAAPAAQRVCNNFPCTSTEQPVQVVLETSVTVERIAASADSRDRFEASLVAELSAAAVVHPQRVKVERILRRPGRLLQAGSATTSAVTITVLPSTATINVTGSTGAGAPASAAMAALASGSARSVGSVLSTVSWAGSSVPTVAAVGAGGAAASPSPAVGVGGQPAASTASTADSAPAPGITSAVLGGAVAGTLVVGIAATVMAATIMWRVQRSRRPVNAAAAASATVGAASASEFVRANPMNRTAAPRRSTVLAVVVEADPAGEGGTTAASAADGKAGFAPQPARV